MSLPSGAERGLRFPSTHLHLFLFTFPLPAFRATRSPDPVLLPPLCMFTIDFPLVVPHRPQFPPTHVCCTASIFMHFVQSITDSGYQSIWRCMTLMY